VKTGTAGEDLGHEAGSLTIPKVTVEANEGLAASNARRLFREKHATYARFIAFVHYPQGLCVFFRRSSLLRSDDGKSLVVVVRGRCGRAKWTNWSSWVVRPAVRDH